MNLWIAFCTPPQWTTSAAVGHCCPYVVQGDSGKSRMFLSNVCSVLLLLLLRHHRNIEFNICQRIRINLIKFIFLITCFCGHYLCVSLVNYHASAKHKKLKLRSQTVSGIGRSGRQRAARRSLYNITFDSRDWRTVSYLLWSRTKQRHLENHHIWNNCIPNITKAKLKSLWILIANENEMKVINQICSTEEHDVIIPY